MEQSCRFREEGEPQLTSVTPACISLPSCPGESQDLFPFSLATPLGEGQGGDRGRGGEDCGSHSGPRFCTGRRLGSQLAGSSVGSAHFGVPTTLTFFHSSPLFLPTSL